VNAGVNAAEAAKWAGLRECRSDLLAARVWALEAQIRLVVTGSAHAERANQLSEKIADAIENCEGLIFHLAAAEHEGPERSGGGDA
jgi:hypothetical protein